MKISFFLMCEEQKKKFSTSVCAKKECFHRHESSSGRQKTRKKGKSASSRVSCEKRQISLFGLNLLALFSFKRQHSHHVNVFLLNKSCLHSGKTQTHADEWGRKIFISFCVWKMSQKRELPGLIVKQMRKCVRTKYFRGQLTWKGNKNCF
jgi:hypothetical protein